MNYHALACELTSWVRSSTISVGTRPGSSSSKLTSKTAVGPALPILDTGDLNVAQVRYASCIKSSTSDGVSL
jgi:hypothetical protein